MKIDDRAIIIRAKNGDTDAFWSIFKKYRPIIYKLQKEYYLRDYDYDDWLQEAQIVCFHSINSYDLDKGLSFGYFYKMNFKRHIFSIIRRQNALKRKLDAESVSLEAKIETGGDSFCIQEDHDSEAALDFVHIRDLISTFDSQLSQFEREVFLLYIRGESKKAIAEKMNCSIEKVKNALDRVKRKFKEYISL